MINVESRLLKDSSDARVKSFFDKVLKAFGEELNKLAELMYVYPNDGKSTDGLNSINDVFALTERAFVGILNNAIIRSHNDAVTLQEFGVYKETKPFGRADLFVTLKGDPSLDFLIEAKISVVAKKKPGANGSLAYQTKLYNQAFSYYSAEEKFYIQKPHIVTITFEWARHKEDLMAVLNEKYEDECTDFYYIYHTDDSGLLVYGTYHELSTPIEIALPQV